jgi:hypothetical protein
MNRTKAVRVSPEELESLKGYRAEQYDDGIPLGYVISQLIEEVTNNE